MIPRRLARAVKEAGMQYNPTFFHKIFYTAFWFWFELKYDIMETFLLKTAAWRLVHSKTLNIKTPHQQNEWPITIEDIEIYDQWGFWLPYGFEIISQAAFDESNKFNAENNFELDVWKDFCDGDYPHYMLHVSELTPYIITETVKTHLKRLVGDAAYDKEFDMTLHYGSEEYLDSEKKRAEEWRAGGCQPYQVVWTEQAKQDLKDIEEGDGC